MKLCCVEGCSKPVRARDLCQSHYQKWQKSRDPHSPPRQVQKGLPCGISGCNKPISCRGWCSLHYQRWRRTGDPLGTISFTTDGVCVAAGCDSPRYSKGYCQNHYHRFWKYGTPTGGRESPKRQRGEGTNNNGYHFTTVYKDGVQRQIGTHRLVMQEYLGRELRKGENVHHINGNRGDNRIENLELWVKTQPCGQRPQDLVKWAREILALYEREVRDGLA